MSNIIAVSLEKGGVGKTTTALNIGAGLRQVGQNVLLVDLDQQSHLSRWLDFETDGRPTVSKLIYQEVSNIHSNHYADFIRRNEKEKVDYIPANKMLGGIYAILGADGESNTVLSRISFGTSFSSNMITLSSTAPPPWIICWFSTRCKPAQNYFCRYRRSCLLMKAFRQCYSVIWQSSKCKTLGRILRECSLPCSAVGPI